MMMADAESYCRLALSVVSSIMQWTSKLALLGLMWMACGHVLAAKDPCATDTTNPRLALDARTLVDLGSRRVCGLSARDEQSPETADVVIWEVGGAAWARSAAMHKSGAVVIAEQTPGGWRELRRLRSPQPAAYGGFGTQVASDGRWLAVLARRPQGVWVFDLQNLDAAPLEIEGARGFAMSVGMLDGQVVVGGQGEARLYRKQTTWLTVARVAAPAGAADAFSGQIVTLGDLMVSTTSGFKNEDGGAAPGRVDVYRRQPTGWQWEARLTPAGSGGPFGSDCCVALANGQITVRVGNDVWRFTNEGTSWVAKPGGTP
jgi:hypothetical protein